MNDDDLFADGTWEDENPLSPEQAAEFQAHNRHMIQLLVSRVETTRAIDRAKETSRE
jgi:hypothetical protein